MEAYTMRGDTSNMYQSKAGVAQVLGDNAEGHDEALQARLDAISAIVARGNDGAHKACR
jgi:hypothetical protein